MDDVLYLKIFINWGYTRPIEQQTLMQVFPEQTGPMAQWSGNLV
jgi:hypothetical protein